MELRGLATGIGSLPHKDVEAAIDLIFEYTPRIPFWPQLPKRDIREGMVAQFSENFPNIKVTSDGLYFKPDENELEAFYDRIISHDVDYFKISQEFALGLHRFYQRLDKADLNNIEFIKCQVCGPFTFAASINDDKGIALLHNPVFMQVVLKGLGMKALWQINLFRKFGKKIILFFDEPYLGCFGSAYTPINREEVVKGLTELTASVKSAGVLLGVHCCGNTDWSIFTDIETIDIISFDAFGYAQSFGLYAANLKSFLRRGGIICWGIVPTQEFTDETTPDLLWKKLRENFDVLIRKGLDKDSLFKQMLLSPSCGLGSLDPEKSDKIFRLLCEVSEGLGDKR